MTTKTETCQSCMCQGHHETWQDCSAALKAEDLRSTARYARPRKAGLKSRREPVEEVFGYDR